MEGADEKTLFGDTRLLKQLLNISSFSPLKFYFCSAEFLLTPPSSELPKSHLDFHHDLDT